MSQPMELDLSLDELLAQKLQISSLGSSNSPSHLGREQHTRNVRRFLFYPVPDGIMVADLRASLAFRLGPVERICVIDWLADVHFSAQLEHEALRYSVPIGPTGALCQSNALVL
ncbi:hypothetical protein CcaverHIS002_0510420 [Cutaneotrichosporon cavernicola]|nr:hypothetical protein CcaverHIS002_0510420 [Cutaneotrichosporon cavernicola]